MRNQTNRRHRRLSQTQTATHRTLNLSLEVLERRQMLDGKVTAVLTGGGAMVLRGDNLSNSVTVEMTSPTQLTISGFDNTTVRFRGRTQVVHTVDVGDNHFNGNLRVIMRNGDDTVFVQGLSFQRSVFAKFRSGDNSFEYSGDVGRDLIFDGDRDSNEVVIEGNVGRNVNLQFGPDGDDVIYVDRASIGGTFMLTSRSGDDEIAISDSTLTGTVNLLAGNGENDITIEEVQFGAATNISSGSGDDSVTIDTVDTPTVMRVLMGAGNNTLDLSESQLHDVSIGGGIGEDSITVADVAVATDIAIGVSTGADEVLVYDSQVAGRLNMGSSLGDLMVELDNVTVGHLGLIAGSGRSQVDIRNATVQGTANVATQVGEAMIRLDDVIVTDVTTISSTDGNDTILIDADGGASEFADLSISSGAGNDVVAMHANSYGNVSVLLGSGTDSATFTSIDGSPILMNQLGVGGAGAGANRIEVVSANVTEGVVLVGGLDDDTIEFSGSYGGGMLVGGSGGNDTVRLDQVTGAALWVDLGLGGDSLDIARSSFSDLVYLRGNAGFDALAVNTTSFVEPPTIVEFEQL